MSWRKRKWRRIWWWRCWWRRENLYTVWFLGDCWNHIFVRIFLGLFNNFPRSRSNKRRQRVSDHLLRRLCRLNLRDTADHRPEEKFKTIWPFLITVFLFYFNLETAEVIFPGYLYEYGRCSKYHDFSDGSASILPAIFWVMDFELLDCSQFEKLWSELTKCLRFQSWSHSKGTMMFGRLIGIWIS